MNDIKDLDLNLCKVFLTVAKLGSISKAANELYVSQPAVSYSIKLLEEELNCKLFNRNAKGVELTADAVKLMYYIENAYNTLKTGIKLLNDSNDLLQGEVRLGVPTHICIFLVSEVIELFNKNYPGIKFSIVNKYTAEIVDMLEKREIDIIIDSYPIESVREDVTFVDLISVDNCFVASNKYINLLDDNKKLSMSELEQYPLLLQPEKSSARKALENAKVDMFPKFNPNIEVTTTEVMLDLVKKGLGIGYFAKMSVLEELQAGELIEIPIKEELPETKICMAYIKEFLTSAPKKFAEIIEEKAKIINSLKNKAIRLILLQDCTYDCDFCLKEGIKSKRESLLTPEDIGYMFKIFNKNYGIKTVQLIGGEPFLRKDLKEIITSLKEEGATVKVTSNGYLLKENMWIGKMVDSINISMHSMNEEKYESVTKVNGSYKKVIEAIKEFRFKYPTLKFGVNTYLLKDINDSMEEIEELVKFATSIRSDLKIIETYPKTGDNYISIESVIPKIKQLNYRKVASSFRRQVYSNGTHNIHLKRCSCSVVAESNKRLSCKENNDIYISQDGKINLCRNSEETLDLCNMIKNKNEDELIKILKNAYQEMGNKCEC